jgi:fatty acid kinase fatty acid binding subunit
MSVRIVTDSASDLEVSEATELGVEIVPLTIRFGPDEFVDRVDLSVDEFYQRLAASPTLPETAAPAPGAFEAVFRRLHDDGADAVVCINLSSALSATMQSAQNAARALEGTVDVRVVDSRSASSGVAGLVIAAAAAAEAGKSADDIVGLTEDMARRTRLFGALDTLENLRKGGRIGGAQALLGQLLSIKPIITVVDGAVAEAGKARTRRKAVQWLADKVLAEPAVENLAVMHGQAPDVDELVELLAARHPAEQLRIGVIGATIGVHAGPRVLGVTYQVPD